MASSLKRYRMSHIIRRMAVLFLAGVMILSGSACTGKKKIVLTTGFEEGELFKIDKATCSVSEYMVYLTNMQNMYENTYGDQIWEMTTAEGEPLEDGLKETVLSRLSRVKVMNLLAEKKKVVLSKEDEKMAKAAAKQYYESLNDTEKQLFNLTEKDFENMYREYALANRLYGFLVKDINPEISDDEARTITVSHIFLRTYQVDSSGERTEYSDSEKEAIYEKAEEILLKLEDGEKFEDLAVSYNEDEKSTFLFRRGETDPAYEEVAFNLATDEISGVVTTPDGYYIIRCDNMFDRDETDENKLAILNEKRNEAFEQEYNAFLEERTGNLNEEAWAGIHAVKDDAVHTADFFVIYGSLFQ
jgi:foldase protein PrsA